VGCLGRSLEEEVEFIGVGGLGDRGPEVHENVLEGGGFGDPAGEMVGGFGRRGGSREEREGEGDMGGDVVAGTV
jgi:hypothetical protein